MKKMDERQIAQDNKIMAELGRVLLYGLMVLIFLKTWVWKVPHEEVLPEFYLMLGASIYSIVRRLMLGTGLFISRKKKIIMPITVVLTGVVTASANWYLSRERYAAMPLLDSVLSLGILFACSTAFVGLIYLALWYVDRRRQRSIDKTLDE